ncbi:Crp/Fnr family transcriptional regulator [Leptospira sp. 201903071]|uniref:Crp/Fnr family transcriptional regulator n=1 Tax=Leptospira ainazelensis TaxID=2810034 RepID=UPI001962C628|nr:Crp/Fnr family transcriptional regulator [Leptospira ainazelensis]MBM9498691.1 Crp/Fnr family transcriptional regulator [Leptospira ainazelensis]
MSSLTISKRVSEENEVSPKKKRLELVPKYELTDSQNTKHFEKNALLFSEGDSSNGFYIVRKGYVRSFRHSKTNDKQQTFKIHYPGSWVGFRDAVMGGTYRHDAVALEDTEVQFVSQFEIQELLHTNREFSDMAFDKMTQECVEAENKIYSMGIRHTHAKLSEFLLERMKEVGAEIELPFTRDVLASIIGATTETLVRALSDFKCRDWIEIEKRKILIKNEAALESLLD